VEAELQAKIIENLLIKREEAERKIKEIADLKAAAHNRMGDKRGGAVLLREVDKTEALFNQAFSVLRKINARYEKVKSQNFSGLCPICGADMTENLAKNPLLEICCPCQKKKNGF
jgi:RNA polymerase-binding transcription factor DksA